MKIKNRILEFLLYLVIFSYYFLNGNSFAGLGIHNWLIILFDLIVLMEENTFKFLKIDRFLFYGITFSLYAVVLTFIFNGLSACVSVLKIIFFVYFSYGISRNFSNYKAIFRLFTFISILTAISGIFAYAQFFKIEWGYDVWEKLHPTEDLLLVEKYRPIGLCSGPIEFSYMLTFATPICISQLFFNKEDNKKLKITFIHKIMNVILTLLVLIGVWFNQSRSSIISCSVIIVFSMYDYLFNQKGHILKKIGVIFLVVLFSVICFSAFDISETLQNNRFAETESASARLPLILTGLNYFIHNPLGGGAVYTPDEKYFIDFTGNHYEALATDFPHNMIVNSLVCYGIIGCLYIIYVFSYSIKLSVSQLKFEEKINFILLCMLISYMINAMFHNAYLLNGEAMGWCVIGFIIAMCKQTNKN